MLDAYWSAGTVDWDDIIVKPIGPPPSARETKVRRPSLETKVRNDQIERAVTEGIRPPDD